MTPHFPKPMLFCQIPPGDGGPGGYFIFPKWHLALVLGHAQPPPMAGQGPIWSHLGTHFCLGPIWVPFGKKNVHVPTSPGWIWPKNMGLGKLGVINSQKRLPSRLKLEADILTRSREAKSGLQKFRWICKKIVSTKIQVFGGLGPSFGRTGFWGPRLGGACGPGGRRPTKWGSGGGAPRNLGPIWAHLGTLAAIPFGGPIGIIFHWGFIPDSADFRLAKCQRDFISHIWKSKVVSLSLIHI